MGTDHNKGLISSSSSTLPTPPRPFLTPPPFLPEEHPSLSTIKGLISSSSTRPTLRPPSPSLSPPPSPKDHSDKGLISSSTSLSPPPYPVGPKPMSKGLISSTRPSLRPYQVASKPLSNKLRSEIINLHGESYAEPENCIDPDDPDSWKPFRKNPDCLGIPRRYLFHSNLVLYSPGTKIYGSSVFELYYIMIKKLDPMREFSSIIMKGSNTFHRPFIIYNRPEGEEIKLNQPLPLKNIFRLPDPICPVVISLSNPYCVGWRFWYEPLYYPMYKRHGITDPVYKRHQKDFKDELTDSVASISYELIESAAVAELQFTFVDKRNRPIKILDGSIFATTDGEPCTKRLVQQFSSSKPWIVLQSNEPVPVNRSIFGVPLDSSLHIEVNLIYFDGQETPSHVEETLIFKMPEKTELVEKYIDIARSRSRARPHRKYMSKMTVKVSWWNYIE